MVEMDRKTEMGKVSWLEFHKEIILQYGPDEFEDPLIQEYYKAFIKIAHLVDETEKNLISLFLAGLREDLRAQVKLSKPLTMVAAYRNVSARETITTAKRKESRPPSLKIFVTFMIQNVGCGTKQHRARE